MFNIPLTSLFSFGLIAVLPVMYLWLEPGLLRDSKGTHMLVSLTFVVAAVGSSLQIILESPFHLPSSLLDAVSQLLLVRMAGQLATAHVFSFIMLSALVVVVFIHEHDGWKGALYMASIAYFGDAVWLTFYLSKFWDQTYWASAGIVAVTTYLTALVTTWLFIRKYGRNKFFFLGLAIFAGYIFAFYISGFHMTVYARLTSFAPAEFERTQWYSSLASNAIEVVGTTFQVILFATIELLTVKRQGLRQLYSRGIP